MSRPFALARLVHGLAALALLVAALLASTPLDVVAEARVTPNEAVMPIPHRVDQAYLYLSVYEDSLLVELQITTRDLERALAFGWDAEAGVDLAQVESRLDAILAYMGSNMEMASGETGVMQPVFRGVDLLSVPQGDFVVLKYAIDDLETIPDIIEVEFTPIFEIDRRHRNELLIWHNWKTGTFSNEAMPTLIFSPGNPRQTLDLSSASLLRGFIALIHQGVLHIWIGIDHIFFLMALILPSVLVRREGTWQAAPDFRAAFLTILGIVTSFTVAHSITLALAGLEVVSLPSRLVESIIAASIAVAAAANLMPKLQVREWTIAFGFGLFHGFGFASVMGDIGVGREHLALSVFGFNVGVELGQIAIILVAFPLLFLMRRWRSYEGFMRFGSYGLIAMALVWFSERAFGFNIPVTSIVLYVPRLVGSALGLA